MGSTLLLDAAIVGALVLAVLLVVGLIMWKKRMGMGWSLFWVPPLLVPLL